MDDKLKQCACDEMGRIEQATDDLINWLSREPDLMDRTVRALDRLIEVKKQINV